MGGKGRVLGAAIVMVLSAGSIARAQSPAAHTAERPAALIPLYLTFAGIQALDFDSTLRAIGSGSGREGNPAVEAVAQSPGKLLALKVGTTTAIVWTSERLRKAHHPAAAVVLMIAVNSAYAAVAAHNYMVVQGRN